MGRSRFLVVAGVSTALVLMATVSSQLYDSNFYVMGEAGAILAGDRPYRDFFEVGVPLAAYMAAGVQWIAGQRLIGEFVRQWIFIVAGVTIAFHLSLRLTHSVAATAVALPVTLALMAATPTYHYPKLFLFPLFVWLAWRYVESPAPSRAAALAGATAAAFLYRHDFGLYGGALSVLALVIARLLSPGQRLAGAAVRELAVYALVIAVVLAPWAIAVQASEGLGPYTQARLALYERPAEVALTGLLANPIRPLLPAEPPRKPAVVRFVWRDGIDDARRTAIEQQIGLRRLDELDARGRWHYAVANAYDPRLLELDPYINDGEGFEWERLRQVAAGLPEHAGLQRWLQQLVLLVPLLLLGRAAWLAAAGWWRARAIPADCWRLVLVAALLVVVDLALFREAGYLVIVAPLTAAMGAVFAAGTYLVTRVAAITVFVVATGAAVIYAREPLRRPTPGVLAEAYGQLFDTPAADGNPYAYLQRCTRPGDRILITGQTPGFVSYHAQRPMAGGHVNWHLGWRSDPAREAESLAMIERSPVPFAVSTHDPVLVDFRRYPRIHQYLERHYRPLDGTGERILVDTRRRPNGTFGPAGHPCFR